MPTIMFFIDLNVHYIGRYVPANERGRCRPVLGAPFRHHALPQDLVDPREMAFAFRAEPVEDVGLTGRKNGCLNDLGVGTEIGHAED